jgi:hypothetical protein
METPMIKSVTNCPLCGTECIVGGEGETHFYIQKQKVEQSEYKALTGWNTFEENYAYDKGREDEQKVAIAWIEDWDGSTNSVMGRALFNKMGQIFGRPPG